MDDFSKPIIFARLHGRLKFFATVKFRITALVRARRQGFDDTKVRYSIPFTRSTTPNYNRIDEIMSTCALLTKRKSKDTNMFSVHADFIGNSYRKSKYRCLIGCGLSLNHTISLKLRVILCFDDTNTIPRLVHTFLYLQYNRSLVLIRKI